MSLRQHHAALTASMSAAPLWIVVPGAPWGGTTAVLGPYTPEQARQWLDEHLEACLPECPPKLVKAIEDYA